MAAPRTMAPTRRTTGPSPTIAIGTALVGLFVYLMVYRGSLYALSYEDSLLTLSDAANDAWNSMQFRYQGFVMKRVEQPAAMASMAADYGVSTKDKPIDPSRYEMARQESLGFFNDIDEEDWLRRKEITAQAHARPINKMVVGFPKKRVAMWHASNFEPEFVCDSEDTVGGAADGRKWVCDPHRLNYKGCLVYSIGSNGDFTFESGINKVAPLCEIHTFDLKDYSKKMEADGIQNAHFHQFGLKSSYESDGTSTNEFERGSRLRKRLSENIKTLAEIREAIGHQDRDKIDIFKIDCEGCEWGSHKDLLSLDLRQILVEMHEVPDRAEEIMKDFRRHGYVIYHKEANAAFARGNAVEYSFLKLNQTYFDVPGKR